MILLPSLSGQAYDVELPGERRLEIHGFYEGRLRAMGQDIPFGGHGASISTFRHVLNVETDVEIFPDGFGPFDFMVGFTRWLVSYECVYERGCGLFKSMDNFGGDSRSVNREPRNFRHARTRQPYAGGVYPLTFRPGSLDSPIERITPSHRYRTIRNPNGVFVNPFPLAAFANLETRTPLDQPIDGGTSVSQPSNTRAGFQSLQESIVQARLVSSRAALDGLGDPFAGQFDVSSDSTLAAAVRAQAIALDIANGTQNSGRDTFQNLNDSSIFARLDPQGQNGLATGRLFGAFAAADRLRFEQENPGLLGSLGIKVPRDAQQTLEQVEEARQQLFEERVVQTDPEDPNSKVAIRSFETLAAAFVGARPDQDKFAPLALANGAGDLLRMQWGATRRADSTNIAWLATIDTHIRPLGYFTGEGADLVSEFAVGATSGIAQIATMNNGGNGFTNAARPFFCREIDPDGADSGLCNVPDDGDLGDTGNALIPRYFGPDGRSNTTDDLPIAQGSGLHKLYLTENDVFELKVLNDQLKCTRTYRELEDPDNPGEAKPLCNTPNTIRNITPFNISLNLPEGSPLRVDVLPERGDPGIDCSVLDANGHPTDSSCAPKLTDEMGNCLGDGVNLNGECVLLMAGSKDSVGRGVIDPGAILLAGDRSLRPGTATDEPAQLTGLGTFSTGNTALLARPRNPAGGLSYQTAGLKRFLDDHNSIVSNLDIDFTEDELRWEHGAGQDEHEFKEGYVEFEMMDSEIFARVGKLLWVWGKTELFRNQDRLNPVDIGLGALSRLEESRLAQWGFQVVYSPEAWMSLGPVEDMRVELVVVTDDFEPTDLGKCGEGLVFAPVCGLSFGSMAHGLAGLGVVGAVRPDQDYNGLKAWDYGVRLEGRWDRFTFALTDFWGWDDAFYIDLVTQYGRRVDPDTGAPVRSTGPLKCSLREARDENDDVIGFLGPDGRQGTPDDLVASEGNCLLFGEPDEFGVQDVRMSADIALSHTANQTLFHTICTLTFDADAGSCAVDGLNNEVLTVPIASVLSGGSIARLAVLGTETVRSKGNQFTVGREPQDFADATFASLRSVPTGADLGSLDFRRRALLGCGESFGSGCGSEGAVTNYLVGEFDEGIGERIPDQNPTEGGIDFMNADASILTQEFTILKVASPWTLVGHRNGMFEAGVTRPLGFTPDDAMRFVREFNADVPTTAPQTRASGPEFNADPGTIRGDEGRYELSGGELGDKDLSQFDSATNEFLDLQVDLDAFESEFAGWEAVYGQTPDVPTDFLIEPTRWKLATRESVLEDWKLGRLVDRRGRVLDPNAPDLNDDQEKELREASIIERDRLLTALDNQILFFQDARIDVTGVATESNLDLSRTDSFGENCSRLYGGPDPGCTDLEIISQNLERFLMANEIVGGDDVFDPPETFLEVVNMLDLNPDTDVFGDPISGADGIVFNNYFAAPTVPDDGGKGDEFGDFPTQSEQRIVQRKVVAIPFGQEGAVRTVEGVKLFPDGNEVLKGLDAYQDCANFPNPRVLCFESFGTQNDGRLRVSAMPIGMPGQIEVEGGEFKDFLIPTLDLDPLEIQALLNSDLDFIEVPRGVVEEGFGTILDGLVDPSSETVKIKLTGNQRAFFAKESFGAGDLDDDLQPDLDEDRNGVFDGLDDGTPGPVSDDNILCGSGIPGDPLQEAVQTEYVNAAQADLEREHFAGGLPPRSPVFCSSLVGILGITGQTLPLTRAGGDSRYGRRDFLWHGGREVALNFQKRNTFGFSLDFAEDTTKSSWGFEFSWTADKLYGDSRSYTGLHSSDEYALTISVDRPTFFNFLNPNRSFFVNFQVNLRYFDDYVGGEDERDGMFGTAEGPLSAFMVLTFFTGYFQDRLNPGFNIVYDQGTGSAAILTNVGYRWNERFSTSVRLNHFFGHTTEAQGAWFPIALNGHPDTTSEITRGLTAVKNRDVAILTVRYTF